MTDFVRELFCAVYRGVGFFVLSMLFSAYIGVLFGVVYRTFGWFV